MRIPATTLLLALSPTAAWAGTMPQMDFHNPLTLTQVGWMVVILVVLYLLLARWGLPEMGRVLENRAQVIARDLADARAAKAEADQRAMALRATIAQARAQAQAEVAEMTTKAKARAAANAAALAARLDKNLAESEQRIARARAEAMAALKPVAVAACEAIWQKLTGGAAPAGSAPGCVDAALAAKKAA